MALKKLSNLLDPKVEISRWIFYFLIFGISLENFARIVGENSCGDGGVRWMERNFCSGIIKVVSVQ